MRVLLDECVPRTLKQELDDHEAQTVVEIGWSGIENGALLRRAAADFDVLVTVDTNLEHQQNVAALPLPVIVIYSDRNEIGALRARMDDVRALLASALETRLYRVGGDDR